MGDVKDIELKGRIVHEATAMFLEEGIKSVRMDDIAVKLGVSKRTLYEMFTDKNDLLEQSVKHHFDLIKANIINRASEARNVFEEVFAIMNAFQYNERHKVMAMSLCKFYPDIYRRFRRDMHSFSDCEFDQLLDRGVEQGLLRPDLNKGLAKITLTYTIHALFDQRHSQQQHDGLSLEMAFEYVIVNFFRGLSTSQGIEMLDEIMKNYKSREK